MKTTYSLHCIVTTVLIFIFKTVPAQTITFEKTFGGSRMDYGHALARTADGGFILAGQTFSYGDSTSDTWLVKTDASGNQQWMKTMGSDTLDGANSIVQTSDGGYFVTNHTEGYGVGDCEAWMFKTDASGIILWSQTYGGLYDDVGESGIETSTGDFIATGIERVDNWQGNVFIAKYSSTGSTVWIKNYTCTQSELGMRILEAADGGYAVAGTLYDTLGAPQDIFIFKTDSAGNLLWNKTYGGAGEEAAFGFCLSPDGGYVVSGTSTSFGSGDKDAYLLKVDADGNQQWSRNYGGLKDDGIYTVAATGDGFITAGATFSFTDSIDMLIIKTDIYGNQLWMKTIGTPGYISGANWLTICDDEGIAIVGNKQPIGSDNGQMLFIKTDSHGDIENIQSPNLTSSSFDVYPVPVTTDLNLAYDNSIINPEIRIFNSMGSLVIETTGQKKINTSALSSGLYYVTLTKDEQLLSQKFIKR